MKILATLALLLLMLPSAMAEAAPKTEPAGLSSVATFFVGGRYVRDGQGMAGQAHVMVIRPRRQTHATPLVFVPGAGQTVTNFLSTPDGRPGWAQVFADAGWVVYLMDQPGRGASSTDASYGPVARQTPAFVAKRFTATQDFAPLPGQPQGWPQARLHTGWPGTGKPGDPVFDQFYASQVASASGEVSAHLVADAGAALLDRIGPAIVVTHSQSGAFGWAIGEARPALVRAIVAVEPSGPPFFGAPPPWGDSDASKLARPYGLTTTPLAYAPALSAPSDLKMVQDAAPQGPDLIRCWQQAEPARKLVNLARFPILILTSETSYHAGYDHCTAAYLRQAGVDTTFMRLADHGLHGDGHMVMLEKHSGKVAGLIAGWLDQRGLSGPSGSRPAPAPRR